MFDPISERCPECDGHFTHSDWCSEFTGHSALSVQQRVEIYAMVAEATA